jgi:hypothetical protein
LAWIHESQPMQDGWDLVMTVVRTVFRPIPHRGRLAEGPCVEALE